MKKIATLILTILISSVNSQTLKLELEKAQIFAVDNQFIVVGFKIEGFEISLIAQLYNKNLQLVKQYEKLMPIKYDKMRLYIDKYQGIIMARATGKPEGYYIKLNTKLEEINSNPINDKTKNEDKIFYEQNKNKNTSLPQKGNFNPELIHSSYSKKNKTLSISRTAYVDSKIDPIFLKVWEYDFEDCELSFASQSNLIKMDESKILGCFLTTQGELVIYELDSKTGNLISKNSAQIENAKSEFKKEYNICNVFYDEKNEKIIVASERLKRNNNILTVEYIEVIAIDKKGDIKSTQELKIPEYDVDAAQSFELKKCKRVTIKEIGINEKGNYFLTCENKTRFFILGHNAQGGSEFEKILTIGFSKYELSKTFEVINSSFYIENDFKKKFNIVTLESTSKNGKIFFYSETDRRTKSLFYIDISSNQNSNSVNIKEHEYEKDLPSLYQERNDNIFDGFIIEDRIIYYEKDLDNNTISVNYLKFE